MKNPDSYKKRSYRALHGGAGLESFEVKIKDTDLHIMADQRMPRIAEELALQFRLQIEGYISTHPAFLSALKPLPEDPLAPPIVKEMLSAAAIAGVGPMAAVAGTIAEYVGRAMLSKGCHEVLVENGGDLFLARRKEAVVAIFAGESPVSMRIGIKLPEGAMPVGVCTSSGTVGHSLSFGAADSVTVLADSTALADAAATRLGNEFATQTLEGVLEKSREIEGIRGVVLVRREQLGCVGDVELVRIG